MAVVWSTFSAPYEAIVSDIKSRFEKSNRTFQKQLGYAPIESMKGRVKAEDSARKKLEKRGMPFDEKSLRSLTDLAGVRVICKFLDDIPEIVGLIKSWESPRLKADGGKFSYEQISIVEEQDFVSEPKQSGYRSHHLVCKTGNLLFEIQVRTISMDFWATTEHMLKYKYKGDLPEDLKAKLRSIAEISSTLDMAMNDIRQDVNIGTAKSRLLDQFYKAIGILEQTGLSFKAEAYREQFRRVHNDLEALKSLAIRAKEDVPQQYWND